MGKYLLRRLMLAIPTLVAASLVIFALLHLAPGGPLYVYVGDSEMSSTQVERLKVQMGLDKPVHIQYLRWASSITRGDWGISYRTGQPVLQVIAGRVPATLQLMVASTLLALLLAIPIGILSAISRDPILQYGSSVFAMLGISIPSFWLGLMFILFFSVRLDLLPSGGAQSLSGESNLWDKMLHLIGPTIVLATYNLAGWSRYVRSSMLEVMRQDYIRTAYAKGLRKWVVLTKHAMRNALIPLITLLGMEAPRLFAGAMVTEVVFSWPGVGRLLNISLLRYDYPVLMGCLTIMTGLVIMGNILADMGCALVDPRVRLR